jgi:hypothetical protein
VREILVELGGKQEVGISLNASDPKLYKLWLKILIKRSVDLHDIEVSGDQVQRVKAGPVHLRVHESVPVRVGPSGSSNVCKGRHLAS